MITSSIRAAEAFRYCRVSVSLRPLTWIPFPRGCVTPRSQALLHHECRNVNRLAITCASRLPLRSRLTLIRLTLFRKPWVFGVDISISIVVTYAYIFVSSRSSMPHSTPSRLTGMLPYRCIAASLSFGAGFDARSSSTHHRSTSELLRTL